MTHPHHIATVYSVVRTTSSQAEGARRVWTAQDTRLILQTHFAEDAHRRKTVRNAMASASLLNRTLVFPRMLCYVDHMWKEMRAGRFAGAYGMSLPFDCPMDYLFELPRCEPSTPSAPLSRVPQRHKQRVGRQ